MPCLPGHTSMHGNGTGDGKSLSTENVPKFGWGSMYTASFDLMLLGSWNIWQSLEMMTAAIFCLFYFSATEKHIATSVLSSRLKRNVLVTVFALISIESHSFPLFHRESNDSCSHFWKKKKSLENLDFVRCPSHCKQTEGNHFSLPKWNFELQSLHQPCFISQAS